VTELPHDQHILLEVPASYAHVRLARLVASGVGSAADFDVEEIEDLRIAVDEACGLLVEAGAVGRLRVCFQTVDGSVLGRVSGLTSRSLDQDTARLATEILGSITTSWEHRIDGDHHEIEFRLQRGLDGS
jgi:serine/threonine-protein kinase RsbW